MKCRLLTIDRVHMGPGKPGKSWNFILKFSRTGKSWKKTTGARNLFLKKGMNPV